MIRRTIASPAVPARTSARATSRERVDHCELTTSQIAQPMNMRPTTAVGVPAMKGMIAARTQQTVTAAIRPESLMEPPSMACRGAYRQDVDAPTRHCLCSGAFRNTDPSEERVSRATLRLTPRRSLSMKALRRLIVPALLAAAAAVGFSAGRIVTAPVAEASAVHRHTLRLGDRMMIPAVGQVCAVYMEGGEREHFCARPRHARDQVAIFRDSILIWKVGDPDRPAWSGNP